MSVSVCVLTIGEKFQPDCNARLTSSLRYQSSLSYFAFQTLIVKRKSERKINPLWFSVDWITPSITTGSECGAVISAVTKANCSFPWKALCVFAPSGELDAHPVLLTRGGSWKLLKGLKNNQGCDSTPINPCQVMETQLQSSELVQGQQVDLGSFITVWKGSLLLKKFTCGLYPFLADQ